VKSLFSKESLTLLFVLQIADAEILSNHFHISEKNNTVFILQVFTNYSAMALNSKNKKYC
jgi:hypothetical protein